MTVFLCGCAEFCHSQSHHRSLCARPLLLFSDFPNRSSTWSSVHTHGNHCSLSLFTVKTKEKQTLCVLSVLFSGVCHILYRHLVVWHTCLSVCNCVDSDIFKVHTNLAENDSNEEGRMFIVKNICVCVDLGPNRTSA